MNNGIIFGDQGPLMQGTWCNPHTGDYFTVMDSFFDNGQFMVKTTDGRVLGYDLIQNYIQTDKPDEILKQKKEEPSQLPAEVLNEIDGNDDILPEDVILLNPQRSLGNLHQPISTPITTNVGIIAKALGKASKPEVVANISWKDFPKKQIEMLNEIMEIDTKEIVEWYTSQLDTTEIAIAIHNSIISYINDQLYGRVDNTIEIDLTLESEKHTEKEPINATGYITRTFTDTPKTSKKTTSKKTTKNTKK